MLVGVAFLVVWCGGCSREGAQPNVPPPPQLPGLPKDRFNGDPDDATTPASGPLADARRRVQDFERRRAKIEPLLEKALADRDELVVKLREAGVNSPADLKGNLRGQKLAESVQKVIAEIEGLERQVATLDAALLDARAVIRRLEREQAGIPDDEMRKLAEQLRDAEERTDGTPLPVTPLDVDAAVEKALKGSASTPKRTATRNAVPNLVGKWQVAEGRKKGTIEFTKGGTALLVWSDGLRNALGESERRATLKYSLSGTTLKLEEPGDFEYRQKQEIRVEVVSPDEMIFVVEKRAMSFDWLEGRVRRAK